MFVVIFFSAFFSIMGWSCSLSTNYISDFDDTIKSYTKADKFGRMEQGFSRTSVYPGSVAFFQAIKRECSNRKLFVVTAAIPILKGNVKKTLKVNGQIPYDGLVLRKSLLTDITKYKLKAVEKTLLENAANETVFIGDNTNADPIAYASLMKKFPALAPVTYIHRKDGDVEIGGHLTEFYTYAEVAIAEHFRGRFSVLSVERVVDQVLAASPSELFPPFHSCPYDYKLERMGFSALDAKLKQIESRVRSFCS